MTFPRRRSDVGLRIENDSLVRRRCHGRLHRKTVAGQFRHVDLCLNVDELSEQLLKAAGAVPVDRIQWYGDDKSREVRLAADE